MSGDIIHVVITMLYMIRTYLAIDHADVLGIR